MPEEEVAVDQALADMAEKPDALFTYREEMFRKLGFNGHQAAELAYSHVDWHAAESLLARGCSIETAVDILT